MGFVKASATKNPAAQAGSACRTPEMTGRYVSARREVLQPGDCFQPRSYSFYTLAYCRSAEGAVCLVADVPQRLKTGDILFLPPEVSHRLLLPEHMAEPCVWAVIRISRDFGEAVRQKLLPDAEALPPGLIRLESSSLIGDLFRKSVLEAEAAEPGWEAAVAANTLSILVLLHRAAAEPSKKPEKTDILDQMLTYIDLHLSERITLADVAGHFFISQSTITQTFRKKLGISFYRYITHRRVLYAKSLIDQGAPLESVAEQVGFTDYSAFFRAFKQECGVSPSAYKKERGRP